MKLTVINGSPKTKNSITLQHIYFLEKKNPEHEFNIIHIGKKTAAFEKNPALINDIINTILDSDAVIWSFPVYYALVPSQLKRFIELLFETCPANFFQGKYATSFSTSINFFDHTAHNYMQGISEDLGFSYISSYSAHMDDFFKGNERIKMGRFFDWFVELVNRKTPVPRKYHIPVRATIDYKPNLPIGELSQNTDQQTSNILVLTDARPGDTNLENMTQAFASVSNGYVTIKNIHDIQIKNGCLGCCTCGYENKCIQKDGFTQFYNDHLRAADTIIIAGTIKDHYLSAKWKQFFDRCFFNGHVPVLNGKRLGFIVSGPLQHIQNLREILEGMSETWHMKSIDIVTDEYETGQAITDQIKAFATHMEIADTKTLEFAPRFYRVGGGKIFRDFVINKSAVFKADHIFYKKMGVYKEFPHKKYGQRLSNAMFSFFVFFKPVRKKIHMKMIPGMVAPYQKVLKQQ